MKDVARTLSMAQSVALAAVVLISAAASAAEHFVTANPDNTFTPAVLDIAVGDTVTWSNNGGLHNVRAPGLFRCANGCDGDGGNGDPAVNPWSFSLTFNETGTINYDCEVHVDLGMTGVLNVGGGGGPELAVFGVCPGEIMVTLTGGSPNGSFALVSGNSEGTAIVPGGPCAGTELGLNGPRLLTVRPLDGNGEFSTVRTVGGNLCGVFLQVVDLDSCSTSNVAQIP